MTDVIKGPQGNLTLARFLECLSATGQETLVKYIRDEAMKYNIPKSELQGNFNYCEFILLNGCIHVKKLPMDSKHTYT